MCVRCVGQKPIRKDGQRKVRMTMVDKRMMNLKTINMERLSWLIPSAVRVIIDLQLKQLHGSACVQCTTEMINYI